MWYSLNEVNGRRMAALSSWTIREAELPVQTREPTMGDALHVYDKIRSGFGVGCVDFAACFLTVGIFHNSAHGACLASTAAPSVFELRHSSDTFTFCLNQTE